MCSQAEVRISDMRSQIWYGRASAVLDGRWETSASMNINSAMGGRFMTVNRPGSASRHCSHKTCYSPLIIVRTWPNGGSIADG